MRERLEPLGAVCAELAQWCSYRTLFSYGVQRASPHSNSGPGKELPAPLFASASVYRVVLKRATVC
jgi:hypothetical protein